jgi:hypothetical protein
MSDLSQPVPPPPGAPQQPVKKGLGPLGWILIGCGGLVVIGGLIFAGAMFMGGRFLKSKAAEFEKNPTMAAAKLAVQMAPDLELVSADEEKNTLTIKNTKTGEVMTISAEDAKEGRWTVTTKEGTTVFDGSAEKGTLEVKTDKGETVTFGGTAPQNLPSWLPVYPGGSVTGTYDTTSAEGRTAAFTVTTRDSTDKVLEYYESEFKQAGFKVDKTTYSANNQTGGSVTATSEDQKRTAGVMVGTSGDETSAVVTFQEKN